MSTVAMSLRAQDRERGGQLSDEVGGTSSNATTPRPTLPTSNSSSALSTPVRGGGAQRATMMLYGQRISLLGAVTSAVGALLAQEEAERRVLLAAIQSNLLLASSRSAELDEDARDGDMHRDDALLNGPPDVDTSFVPFEPLRVHTNALSVTEHEERWEVVHEEYAVMKAMEQVHNEILHKLGADDRRKRAIARAVLEREATLRLLEIVCHWETQRGQLDQHAEASRRATVHVLQQRSLIVALEADARQVTQQSEDVKFRQELRSWQQQMLPDDEFDD